MRAFPVTRARRKAHTHNEVDMGISLVGDVSDISIIGNILLAFRGYETYEISLNGSIIKYIYRIKDHRKLITKKNVTIWYNLNMYPFVQAIGEIWIDGSPNPLRADKIRAEFIALDTKAMGEQMDKILAEYVIQKVGDALV